MKWVLFGLFVLGGVSVAFSSFQIQTLPMTTDDEKAIVSFWRVVAFIAAISTVVFGASERIAIAIATGSTRKQLRLQRARLYTAFDGPILRLLDQVESMAALPGTQRASALHAIRHSVIRAACELVEAREPRASYFQVQDPSATRRVLACQLYNYSSNRPDVATTKFVEDSGLDAEIWHVLDGGVPKFTKDVDKHPPASWDKSKQRAYKTFITLRVHSAGVGIGLLTINALKKNELTSADLSMLRSLAELLSAAETIALGTTGVNRLKRSDDRRRASLGTVGPST